jgi:phenylpropionate dioxygenase-like ring-hydroxylating dioxygenase large terminal subunit
VYHGWQFALNGQCINMPNEPPASNFQEKVCQVAYPCTERGGVVWTYMGRMDPASFRIRPASVLLPKEVPWVEGSQARLVARLTSPTSRG